MNTETIFWFEIIVLTLQLIAVYVMGRTLIAVTKSEIFKEKVNRLHDQKENDSAPKKGGIDSSSIVKTIVLAIIGLSPVAASALSAALEEPVESVEIASWVPEYVIYSLGAMIIVLTGVIMYFRKLIVSFLEIDKVKEAKVIPLRETVSYKVMHALTDAVDIEEEHRVMTDHEYDGIRELDNNLPPWWIYGFYVSIVIAVIYFTNYHILKTGDLQIAEYEQVMEAKKIEVAAYLKAQALDVDENTVVILNSDADLLTGKALFTEFCVVCHKVDGGGSVGPNLTDPYWIYDGDIAGVFSTIKYGAKRGMKSWQDELNPVQIQKVSSYVLTFQGTNPPDAKPAEGELFEQPNAAPDSESEDSENLAPEEDTIVAENK